LYYLERDSGIERRNFSKKYKMRVGRRQKAKEKTIMTLVNILHDAEFSFNPFVHLREQCVYLSSIHILVIILG
jgi:hypothetical protein